jgi:uncharacterized protein
VHNVVAIDSGPLIALFDKDDHFHDRAVGFIRKFKGTFVSNYAVVTEVTHLLDFSIRAQIDFLQWVRDGGLTIEEITPSDLDYLIRIVEKYADLPVDFADAALVALCERLHIHDVASVDKHFSVYRTTDKKPFRNVFF